MSAELFIHRSLLPVLLWLALCAILAGIILEALARLKPPRRKPVILEPLARTPEQEDESIISQVTARWLARNGVMPSSEVEWVDQAMDKVIAALEQDETLEWRAQYRVVEEAELVAEQHQARLESEREG